jgi:uncharacterized membrane protein YebE (DUF533 family)
MRKMAAGVVGHGGAAVAGAMAHKACQNWQQGKASATAPLAKQADIGHVDQKFLPDSAPATDGLPFQLVMINAIAAAARGIEQATELYLVSRIAIDVDHPAERAYLQALGHKLNLPSELVAHLDHQVEATAVHWNRAGRVGKGSSGW